MTNPAPPGGQPGPCPAHGCHAAAPTACAAFPLALPTRSLLRPPKTSPAALGARHQPGVGWAELGTPWRKGGSVAPRGGVLAASPPPPSLPSLLFPSLPSPGANAMIQPLGFSPRSQLPRGAETRPAQQGGAGRPHAACPWTPRAQGRARACRQRCSPERGHPALQLRTSIRGCSSRVSDEQQGDEPQGLVLG